MDENKNLTPENENENTAPEEAAEKTASEVTEEVTEEAPEEVIEEAVEEEASEVTEEVTEEEEEEIAEEAVKEEEPKAKSAKGGLVAAIIAGSLAVIAAILLAVMFFLGSKPEAGTGNLNSQGFAAIKGDDIYHVGLVDYKLYKTNIKTSETVKVSEDSPVYISNYKGDIYYLTMAVSEDMMSAEFIFKKYVDGENDIVLFKPAEMSFPQISDGYVYYLQSVPEYNSGYSSRIYRAELKEGATPELCCDVLCNSFYVDGKDLYYGDVDTSSFVKTTVDKAISVASSSPLPENVKRSSAELEAEVVLPTIAAFPVIYEDVLYYVDTYSQSEFCALDLVTGENKSFNNGTYSSVFNIYGDYIYYYSTTDFSFYRMKLDGSDVTRVSALNYYGFSILADDKFMIMEISEEGSQYISVCDLDGNSMFNITFDEQIDAYYDESAIPEEELVEGEETEGDTSEEVAGETVTITSEDAIETTIDLEE